MERQPGNLHAFLITQPSALQPVRRYALMRMRKPCGADDKRVADEKTRLCCCKRILTIFSSFNHPVVFL